MSERALTLYTRRGCPLCDEMAVLLATYLGAKPIRLNLVNIDADPELQAQFAWDVPVLFDGEFELCRHELDVNALTGWLRQHQL